MGIIRKIIGYPLVTVGWILMLGFGLWSLVLDCAILNEVGGFWVIVVGWFLFPVMFTVAPFYAGVAWGDWTAFFVTYGGGLLCWFFLGIGMLILPEN